MSSTYYSVVIMSVMASKITGVSGVFDSSDQIKCQCSASLALVRETFGDRRIPLTKGQQRGKCLHLMTSLCCQLGGNEVQFEYGNHFVQSCRFRARHVFIIKRHAGFDCTPMMHNIKMTSYWARWRLRSPASRLFTQPFIQAHIRENIKAPGHWPVCEEFTGGRRFPRTKGQ